MGTAFAALTDSLQCHWHRPHSTSMHDLLESALHRVQQFAYEAFAKDLETPPVGANPLSPMLTSRWPIVQFLARLEPPPPTLFPWRRQAMAEKVAVVSWSTREGEMGGQNWAAAFAAEVFGGRPNVQLHPDVECADIYLPGEGSYQ